jgi:uncharacterized protein with HEPN domain
MNQERLYSDYLRDILENAEKAISFVAGMTGDEFIQDEKTVFAVIRAIEVIGEATKKIPNIIRDKYPHLPWREMAGTRDKLIHDYFGVNSTVIWKTVTEDIPLLLPLLRQVLENETEA